MHWEGFRVRYMEIPDGHGAFLLSLTHTCYFVDRNQNGNAGGILEMRNICERSLLIVD